jgi:capsule assembly protein Wzi
MMSSRTIERESSGTIRPIYWVVVLAALIVLPAAHLLAQVENVPVSNQVYEFLNRIGVKGVLPLYSNAMIPLSRRDVADFLLAVSAKKEELDPAENDFLKKFLREFAHEINPSEEDAAVLFRDGFNGILSDKEKYLYTYSDSTLSLFVEFVGDLEHRRITGDSYGGTHVSYEEHGGRIRGTIKSRFGYFLQGTDGTEFGDKAFALADPRLRGNGKLGFPGSTNFDFTDAYLRADLDWFNIEFGKERFLVGTGNEDRLLLSGNAPTFDAIRVDAHYKSLRFVFIHGSLVADSVSFPGTIVDEPTRSNKYLALHRIQLSLVNRINIGVSEMTIYQRYSPEFAYLNPINFWKSAEHALGDRDNSFLTFDLEYFPFDGYKIYGTCLIDDIDFSQIGTGWWGNELGWQGGIYGANVLGISNLDADLEYTRLEPYVYSNRTSGNDFTHSSIGLGNHLDPNSDEWMAELSYRPLSKLRMWASCARERHGENITRNGVVVKNVGGSALEGHREGDSNVALFLDGNLVRTDRFRLRAAYEPVTNFILTAGYEFSEMKRYTTDELLDDHLFSIQARVEY